MLILLLYVRQILKGYKNRVPLAILFLSSFTTILAQEKTVKGFVYDQKNRPLEMANVTIIDDNGTIIKYSSSAKDGSFRIAVTADPGKAYFIEVSFIGYKRQRSPLIPLQNSFSFKLLPDVTLLKDVLVRNRPVLERLGDTLRYEVMTFAKPEDRSIGDVLRRMPGINIADDGAIYYNDKKIENLYIHGDDLMDGKYGLAPKVIRKEDIASVDVIRNHQPIKALKGKVMTDNTAIDLVLKNETAIALSTKATIGVGVPNRYDISVTPILLNKTFKLLGTLSANNSSVDYSNNFRQLGSANFIADIRAVQPEFMLSQGTIGKPDVPLAYYYRNNSAMAILNITYNARNGLQYKFNFQGSLDKNRMDYDSRVETYTNGDTVLYQESQALTNKPSLVNTSFNIMSNKEDGFFNNTVRLLLREDKDRSTLNFNYNGFEQALYKKQFGVSNDLNWIPVLKNNAIAEFRWLLDYRSERQDLVIGDGYVSGIPGVQGTNERTGQYVDIPTVFSNAYVSYKIPGSVLTLDHRVGYINEIQELNSSLQFLQNPVSTLYPGDAGNILRWKRQNAYVFSELQFKYGKTQATLQVPIALQRINYQDGNYGLNKNVRDLIVNPNLKFSYNLDIEQRLLASYRFDKEFGNITSIYRGAILKNYRTLVANNADIQKKNIHSANLGYEYEKSISMLFVNGSISYDRTDANTILSSVLTDSIQTTVVRPYKNTISNTRFNAGFSKYIFALKSTAGLKCQISRSAYQQIINDQLVPMRTDQYSLNGSFLKRFFNILSLNYLPSLNWTISKIGMDNGPEVRSLFHTFRADQSMTLALIDPKNTFEIIGRHNYTRQPTNGARTYFFFDASYRRNIKKIHADLSVNVTNLFNIKDYTLYSSYTNQLLISHYILRGRMVIARAELYF